MQKTQKQQPRNLFGSKWIMPDSLPEDQKESFIKFASKFTELSREDLLKNGIDYIHYESWYNLNFNPS